MSVFLILKNLKTLKNYYVSKDGSSFIFRWKGGDTYSVGSSIPNLWE
jgi:hypothetical protein